MPRASLLPPFVNTAGGSKPSLRLLSRTHPGHPASGAAKHSALMGWVRAYLLLLPADSMPRCSHACMHVCTAASHHVRDTKPVHHRPVGHRAVDTLAGGDRYSDHRTDARLVGGYAA